MPNGFSCSFFQKTRIGFGLWCALFLIPTSVQSATTNSATLQWAANSEPDLAGYKVYQGTTAGSYGLPIDVKNVTTYTVSNLQTGLTYSFAITAYDLNGNESYPSDEVSKYIADSSPTLTPTALPLTSPTGTTLSGRVTDHKIIDLAQDLKQTAPRAEPPTSPTTVPLAEPRFMATGQTVTVQPTETSLTHGTTLSGRVTDHEIIGLAQDLKQTAPPAEPPTSPTTVTLAEPRFMATGHAVIVQPTKITLNPGLKGDQAATALERNIQVLDVGKQSVRRTIP